MAKRKYKKKSKTTVVDALNVIGNIISYIPKALYKLSELILIAILNLLITMVQYFKKNKQKTKTNNKSTKKQKDLNENSNQNLDENPNIEIKKVKIKKDKSIDAVYKQFKIIHEINGTLDEFENFIYQKPSTIGIILGKRGSGKSAIGMKLLENIYAKTQRKCYGMGFEESSLPWFIESIDNTDEIQNNSFVLIDEGGILFSSRNSMSKPNKILSELILIARHKDLSIIFISQNSSNIDINIIRQADYLVLKPASLLQNDFERKIIKKIYEKHEKEFKKYKSIRGLTFIYSDIYTGFVSNDLPNFWTQKLSKSFKNFSK